MATPDYTSKDIQRFWQKVDTSGGMFACWEWTGTRHYRGYGQFQIPNKRIYAHRVSWELTHGNIPDGLCVCHHCDNPSCVNPAHLWLGTHQENMGDMVQKGRHKGKSSSRKQLGEANANARMKETDILDIRRRFEQREATVSQLAQEYGLSANHIYSILSRARWTHI